MANPTRNWSSRTLSTIRAIHYGPSFFARSEWGHSLRGGGPPQTEGGGLQVKLFRTTCLPPHVWKKHSAPQNAASIFGDVTLRLPTTLGRVRGKALEAVRRTSIFGIVRLICQHLARKWTLTDRTWTRRRFPAPMLAPEPIVEVPTRCAASGRGLQSRRHAQSRRRKYRTSPKSEHCAHIFRRYSGGSNFGPNHGRSPTSRSLGGREQRPQPPILANDRQQHPRWPRDPDVRYPILHKLFVFRGRFQTHALYLQARAARAGPFV